MILVTGGAGYIGSQMAYQLHDAGLSVVVIDNLQMGDRHSLDGLSNCHLVVGNVGDEHLLHQLFRQYKIDTVMHFAADLCIPESVQDPIKYYLDNTANLIHLLSVCQNIGIKQFIFSSSCAVYGLCENTPVKETATCLPVSPYGSSKLMSEKILADVSRASNMRYAILRYFNVAGADPLHRVGPYFFENTVLVRQAIQVALGLRKELNIYGDDYHTPDGTGVRDYIHVADLANVHATVLDYLNQGGKSVLLNCGYGHGYSVQEVVRMVEKVAGHAVPTRICPRRPGDADNVIADTSKLHATINWQPKYDDLEKIVRDAYKWEESQFKV